jgi:hypothetical protein
MRMTRSRGVLSVRAPHTATTSNNRSSASAAIGNSSGRRRAVRFNDAGTAEESDVLSADN